jgi:hypothetical protein
MYICFEVYFAVHCPQKVRHYLGFFGLYFDSNENLETNIGTVL